MFNLNAWKLRSMELCTCHSWNINTMSWALLQYFHCSFYHLFWFQTQKPWTFLIKFPSYTELTIHFWITFKWEKLGCCASISVPGHHMTAIICRKCEIKNPNRKGHIFLIQEVSEYLVVRGVGCGAVKDSLRVIPTKGTAGMRSIIHRVVLRSVSHFCNSPTDSSIGSKSINTRYYGDFRGLWTCDS